MNEESLFHLAQQQPDAAARAAFLEEACANQPELRARLEKLLQAHDAPVSLFDKPVIDIDTTLDSFGDSGLGEDLFLVSSPSTEGAGTRIGPYKLLQKIGEGGMGIVWMAEQEQPVRRKVALKIIKPGMDSRQVIARFEAERQALALMDHLNIARVLDGGATDSGRPFFVMELIHGIPITKYCDDNQLTPRERLELFVPVCQAIQHAHQKGIIHRDVKPSNVLVTLYDGKPVPKVIDFGVAKAVEQRLTERTLFTQYGSIIGTFEYMSPEQAEMSALGVDTRSDIYSLGVLLYELLTGTTPLERQRLRTASYAEIVRLIREEEPHQPSTRLNQSETLPAVAAARKMQPVKLTKLLRGELDWIVIKALEKDRDRRYETASAFAAEVQHYLNDEPVQACPPSVWYRFGKFARRNKRPVLATSLVLLAVIAGTIIAAQARHAAAEKAAKERAEAREAQTKEMLEIIENQVFAASWPEGLERGLDQEDKNDTETAKRRSEDDERRPGPTPPPAGQTDAELLVQFSRITKWDEDPEKEGMPLLGFLDTRHVRVLLALVPDPVDWNSADSYDTAVTAIQVAGERHGYVLDRGWIPWQSSISGNGSTGAQHVKAAAGGVYERRLGVLVFRKNAGPLAQFLLVFLARETAIHWMYK